MHEFRIHRRPAGQVFQLYNGHLGLEATVDVDDVVVGDYKNAVRAGAQRQAADLDMCAVNYGFDVIGNPTRRQDGL